MTTKQAIQILMLSPCYWLLPPRDRKELIREYRNAFPDTHPNQTQFPAKLNTTKANDLDE